MIDAEVRFEASLANLESRFASLRTGRVVPTLLDAIRVDYHGSLTPLNKLAVVMVDKRDLIVRPFDPDDRVAISLAISKSLLGLSPMTGSYQLRVPVPSLSDDRRRELSRAASAFAEEARVAMRNVRRDAIRAGADLGLPADAWAVFENELEKTAHAWLDKVDTALKVKSAAILEVEGRWKQADEKRRWK